MRKLGWPVTYLTLMQARFIDIDGVPTRYLYAGDERAYPILLIHGHDLIAEVWLENIDELARDFFVLAPDSLGSGFTGPVDLSGRPAIPQRVEHLQKLVEKLGWQRFCACGTSYGALLGTLLYFEMPERIDRLVINGSASAFNSNEALAATLANTYAYAKDKIAEGGIEFWRARVAKGTYDASKIPETLLHMLTTAYAQPWLPTAWDESLRSFMDLEASGPYRILDKLERIAVETLVVWGLDDKGASVEHATEAVARMPDARLITYEQCAHMMMFEHPKRFNQTIRDFLSSDRKPPH